MPNQRCGAKTRSGAPCKGIAMANGRCRMHGGTSTGPHDASRPGNTNAVTHGFYSSALFDEEERDLYSRAAIGNLDDEIRLAKVKLYRYVKRAGVTDLQTLVDGALEVIRKQGTDFEGMPYDRQELKAAAPDYADLIIRTLDLIRKLELARLDIEAEKEEEPPTGIRITVRRATRDAERD
jgi:hypothetical protein